MLMHRTEVQRWKHAAFLSVHIFYTTAQSYTALQDVGMVMSDLHEV